MILDNIKHILLFSAYMRINKRIWGLGVMESVNVELIETKLVELENQVEELRRIIVLSRLKCLSLKSDKKESCKDK